MNIYRNSRIKLMKIKLPNQLKKKKKKKLENLKFKFSQSWIKNSLYIEIEFKW